MKNISFNRALAATKSNKLFSFFLAIVVSLGTANATNYNGYCGNNLTWSLNTEDSTLIISGYGIMSDYQNVVGSIAPWKWINSSDYSSYISSVSLPEGLTHIGANAFSGCTNLTNIIIPDSVTSIGEGAFSVCSSLPVLDNIRYADTYLVNAVDKSLPSYNIKDGTKWIGEHAFQGCSSLTSIEIPNSVTSIGNYAFVYCSGLTSVTIPNSATSIGNYAFRNCSGLTSVTIPNSVTSIGEGAFSVCSGLTSVTIPNSVTSIGEGAFSVCSGLTSVVWNAKNCANCGGFGSQVASFIFGNEVESIPANCCSGMSQLASITIPNSVTSIGEYAFQGCSSLTTVTIPDSVTSIGEHAFSGCSGLTSVIWNAKNCANNGGFGSHVTSFVFGNEVESIPANCCSGMNQLTSITIPNNVTSIGYDAFSGCSSLTSVIWNAKNCTNSGGFGSQVTSFVFGNEVESIPANCCSGMNQLTSITIPNNVTSIGNSAFYGCFGLTSVDISNSVTTIGNEIIYGCTNLSTVVAPAQIFEAKESSWAYYTKQLDSVVINRGELTDNVLSVVKRSYKTLKTLDISATTNTTLPDEAFKDCYNLQTLVLPANLENISSMAVAGCKNLKAIDIPASVEEIEQSAFEDCRSIETITFGGVQPSSGNSKKSILAATSQLRRIGNWAFYNAHELQHIEIPEGVTEIGDGAFYGCTYLEDLVLPSSVQSIGDNCFALCSKLTKIIVNSTTPPEIQAKTFYDVKRQIPVYVPDDCVDAYTSDQYWGEFNIIGQSEAPTGIDNVSSSLQGGDRGRLILRDGQIFILRGEKTYTITGQQVQ